MQVITEGNQYRTNCQQHAGIMEEKRILYRLPRYCPTGKALGSQTKRQKGQLKLDESCNRNVSSALYNEDGIIATEGGGRIDYYKGFKR
jgi:hypothetical protein